MIVVAEEALYRSDIPGITHLLSKPVHWAAEKVFSDPEDDIVFAGDVYHISRLRNHAAPRCLAKDVNSVACKVYRK